MKVDIQISDEPLQIQSCIDWVMSPECGGINVFIGTVRNNTQHKKVVRLEFEAYETMAISEMNKIAREVLDRWPVQKIVIHHRTGVLQPGEVPVVIVVAAAHRDAAFTACRYIIDTLKQTVPIWKKEVFEDGEVFHHLFFDGNDMGRIDWEEDGWQGYIDGLDAEKELDARGIRKLAWLPIAQCMKELHPTVSKIWHLDGIVVLDGINPQDLGFEA